jgi:hypothetical protein
VQADQRKNPNDMSREDPAGIHFFSFWADRAKDNGLVLWMRLVGMAYSAHGKNGHASFCLAGESTLADVLGKPRQQVLNEIRRAVKHGFLSPESNINCLVLPDRICGGADGHRFAECKLHPKH